MGILGQDRLRANPAYELVLLDRLDLAEQELVAEAGGAGDVYGMLRPRRGSTLEPQAVSSDTALLFLTLADGAPLPRYVRLRLGAGAERAIGRLVLDGVLELEQGGGYVSGAKAAPLLMTERSDGGRGRIGELSIAALRYGQELSALGGPLLALRLYFYGRLPASPALRDRWPDEESIGAYLGIAEGGAARDALAEGWVEAPEQAGSAYWRAWRPRRASVGSRARSGACYKLYVSPALEALPDAFAAIAQTLRGAPGLSAFKLGRGLGGVCRPDKLVVYFDRLDDLHRAAEGLRGRLAGRAAHGVPFTAAVANDGLLSWGADPPHELAAGRSGSWRMWVVERLAEYLARERDSDRDGLEPWQFALERLRLAGIDTDTWAPTGGMWQAAEAGA